MSGPEHGLIRGNLVGGYPLVYRLILPDWAKSESPNLPKVLEGQFTDEQLADYNKQHYNIYFLPNPPSAYEVGTNVEGSDIDSFRYVFCDMDLKDKVHESKEAFIATIDIEPSFTVDSGNGIHVYWQVSDLDAHSYLRLQRRLIRKYKTDEAVCKIYQLMRVPGYYNTKHKDNFIKCDIISSSDRIYTCEQLDTLLPAITKEDEDFCKNHYNKTYKIDQTELKIDSEIPNKFKELLLKNKEVKSLWAGDADDRSKADFRLGHLLFAHGFTKDEALSVLVNTAKASTRGHYHQVSYAQNIVEKIWTFELETKPVLDLSSTVAQILNKAGDDLKGKRFPCWNYLDATEHGFRLGQVIGLVAGSGVGKTAMALNMFKGFVQNNPEYEHFFIPLEQPVNEIADRWKTMCGGDTKLYEKVHVISNYAEDGTFRHLSFNDIKEYLLKFKQVTNKKIGCVVIDHIGALKKTGKDGENQDLMTICHEMKAFAVQTDTLLVMQSQSSREKSGIGDLELNKDAAYGTVYFEAYCDYLVTIWQPLKRCYVEEGCPTVTAYKFCKIRHKKANKDKIKEDVCYRLMFEPDTEYLRELTQLEEQSFDYFNKKATNLRKLDRKTDIVSYQSTNWLNTGIQDNGKAYNH